MTTTDFDFTSLTPQQIRDLATPTAHFAEVGAPMLLREAMALIRLVAVTEGLQL